MDRVNQDPALPPACTRLKDLHLTTDLVRAGRARALIVRPSDPRRAAVASRVQQRIRELTGVTVDVVPDGSPQACLPNRHHLILIGDRTSCQVISALYDQFYTLLDPRFPGPGGFEVRTLHNPFGNGRNVVFVGGSDAVGVERAAERFCGCLGAARGGPGQLAIDWLLDIRLGDGVEVPVELTKLEIWDGSKMYGSVGYFGWNSIGKRMALYYMTGDPFHAREVVRLAFPDAEAKAEITRIDGERIENKDEPLSGPYHYNAHLLVLFWDLIEESPVFSDAERLRVTNCWMAMSTSAGTRTTPLPSTSCEWTGRRCCRATATRFAPGRAAS